MCNNNYQLKLNLSVIKEIFLFNVNFFNISCFDKFQFLNRESFPVEKCIKLPEMLEFVSN